MRLVGGIVVSLVVREFFLLLLGAHMGKILAVSSTRVFVVKFFSTACYDFLVSGVGNS